MRMRTIWLILLGLISLSAAAAGPYFEGTHYKSITPKVPTESGNKVEVVELFWYGCPHCYSMEPFVERFLKTKGKNIEFKRIPAVFPNPKWQFHAHAYYTAEALGVMDKFHTAFFEKHHEQNQKIYTKEALAKFFASIGVDGKKFERAFSSFSVQAKVNRAKELTARYTIQSVPSFVVQGKWKTNNSLSGSARNTIEVIKQLSLNN